MLFHLADLGFSFPECTIRVKAGPNNIKVSPASWLTLPGESVQHPAGLLTPLPGVDFKERRWLIR